MNLYLAHAGEIHESGAESAWHAITSEWYIALPLYIVLLYALGSFVYLVSKSKSLVSGVILFVLLLAGGLLYSAAPIVSIVSIAAGFALALLFVITSLAAPHAVEGKKQKR